MCWVILAVLVTYQATTPIVSAFSSCSQKYPTILKMQHSDITSTPNASNCTQAGLNQSSSTSIANNTSVHDVHHNSASTHSSTSSVASPSDAIQIL
jgi:hypothetical protein